MKKAKLYSGYTSIALHIVYCITSTFAHIQYSILLSSELYYRLAISKINNVV